MSGNLDDFFSKRDKKKKPTKAKFSTLDPNELGKQLASASDNFDGFQDQEEFSGKAATGEGQDDEWKPYDSEENRDYSGLRINLNNWKIEDEEEEYGDSVDDNGKQAACPWAGGKAKGEDEDSDAEETPAVLSDATNQKKASTESEAVASKETEKVQEPAAGAAVAASAAVVEEAPKSTTEPEAATAGKYIPPSMRARMQQEQQQTASRPAAPVVPVAAPTAPVEKTSAPYVPPSLRGNRGAESSDGYNPAQFNSVNRSRPKVQPNFNDTMEFPTLGGDMAGGAQKPDGLFEMPKKSVKIEQNKAKSSIDLENKFTALSN